MIHRAYLVRHERTEALTLEHGKAVDYAAKNHGVVMPLVSSYEAKAFIETIQQLAETGNLALILKACKEQLK